MNLLARAFRIQPGEGRNAGLLIATMVLATAGHTIGESGVSALFFERVGADALPRIYLLQGVVGLAAMFALIALLARMDRRRAYVSLLLLTGAAVTVERVILIAEPSWIFPVLWLTVSVAMLVQAVSLWGTAGLVTDTRRAKRLFPLFGAGAILGAVVGGFLTRPLAATIGVQNLLLVWAGCLGVGALLSATVLGGAAARRPRQAPRRRGAPMRDMVQGFTFVRRSPLLAWMTAASVCFSILFFLLYLPFAQSATSRFADTDQLAGFLGVYSAIVTAFAFVASLFLTNRLIGWFGATAMILVLPILYAGSFGALLVSTSFGTIVAVRFGVSVWLQGVCSPAWETLVNVVPESRRDQVRAFLNGGPTQVGTAIAGLVALVGQRVLSARQLSGIGLVIAVVTAAIAWRIRRSYTGALVDALRAGRPSVFEGRPLEGAPIAPGTDGQAVALAIGSSRDPDPHVRRLAVELLSTSGEGRVLGTLVERSTDEDAIVRMHAIRGLARSSATDDPAVFEHALRDPDPGVRRAAIEALRTMSAARTIEPFLADADPAVAAAAGVALLPAREAADRLLELLSDPDPEVRLATVRGLGVAEPRDALAFATPRLEDPSLLVRAEALDIVARAEPEAAVEPGLAALLGDDDGMRRSAFDTLAMLGLEGHVAALLDAARRRGALAIHDGDLAASIPADGDASELLRAALIARGRSHAVVALSALAMASGDREAMRIAIDNLQASESAQLANALETLEASDHRGLARPLFALWEPANDRSPREDWLEAASDDPDPLVRACVDLVRTTRGRGDEMTRSKASMSPMERVLALRRIPLFADLSPADLSTLAAIAEERTYADAEVIAAEGEMGDELHIIVSGSVHVMRGDRASEPIARRGPGDVVGEMSIISRAPRVASLVADGNVRTVVIGQREFESIIRERPEVSLAVMRVLADRLGAETAER